MISKTGISEKIKETAYELGFDACGICRAENIGNEETKHLKNWLHNNYHAKMDYMEGHFEKRCDPTLLVEGAKSIVCLALNYYPKNKQSQESPQFAYYAYGEDYHTVIKSKLQQLFDKTKKLVPELEGRIFCDTAPIMERYWAAKAGLGFIGKNSLLIIPQKGSFFFLGELILNIELEYDKPLGISCGNCTRCMESCPTKAIIAAKKINSNKCISYQTIENKEEIAKEIIPYLQNCLYGCDICQNICPWNRFAIPNNTIEFSPSDKLLYLSENDLDNMTEEEYKAIFRKSAVKRAKYKGLKRNIRAVKAWKNNK